jgi:hypothetical protein
MSLLTELEIILRKIFFRQVASTARNLWPKSFSSRSVIENGNVASLTPALSPAERENRLPQH